MKTLTKAQPPVTEQAQHIRLTYTQPPSNKEYQADLVREGKGWSVNFAFGRIGTALKTGAKTSAPVDYATASQVYAKLVASKVGEGYVADADSPTTSTYQPPAAKEDTGLRPQLLEPITLDQADNFITDSHWCMQPKYDGNRVFVIAKSATDITGANRKGQKISLPLNVVQWAESKLQIAHRTSFTLDGELIGDRYFVFDLLEANGTTLIELPYSMRLSILAQFRDTSSAVSIAETA